ncbi:PrsW family glutamic-type intramembrane protease [Streptomyces sp. NPDC048514]|uniref:PrsW family glutamic-type intramembrane protease n=1 Tax=Streptomyces sp. NPDC048514 TaxID=3365564 RepID=UPI003721EDFB
MTQFPPPGTPRARIPHPQQPPPPYPRIGPGLWRRGLYGGLAAWALTAGAVYATRSTAPLPALILLGGFLVPVVFVLWAYERHGRDLGVSAVLGCFLAGGTLGAAGAVLAEAHLLRPRLGMFLWLALLEEAAKLGVLMFTLRRQPGIRGVRAGLVLGAAVGLGFAAPESIGYAFDAALTTAGDDPRTLLETELLRGVPAPLGHGLWTAIAGGALLSLRRPDGRFRYAPPVIAACMGVCLLHTLWDSTHGIAVRLVARLTGTDFGPQPFAPGRSGAAQEHLFTLFSLGGLALVALAGIGWVRSLARRGTPWRNTP